MKLLACASSFASLAFGLVVSVSAGTVHAEPTGAERALAEALFRQAKQLLTAGRTSEACSKFAESQRLDPGGGTLLNLAVCHELEGKLATAWAEFKDALALARSEGRIDRVELAQEHIAKLEPQLPELSVTVRLDACPLDLQILIDGVTLGKAAWGSPMPVDPGAHSLEANCVDPKTGRKSAPWFHRFELAPRAKVQIDIPRFTPPPPEVVNEPQPGGEVTRDPGRRQRLAGYIAVGAGVFALGAGTYFGLKAIDQHNQSDNQCTNNACTAEGLTLNEDARRNARLSNISLGVGLVSAAVGTWLILSAESPTKVKVQARRAGLRVGAFASPEGGMCSVTQSF